MHVFDESLAMTAHPAIADGLRYEAATHPGFANIIGPYGGWSAALLGKAVIEASGSDMELTSITTDFLAGAPLGPVSVDLDCDREGRSTEFWRATISRGDDRKLANRAVAILARRRETVAWVEGVRPEAPEPEDCDRVDLPMEWAKTVEMRPAVNKPFRGASETQSSCWVRLSPDRPLDPVSLLALADTPTPRLFYVIGRPEFIATVSMTVYLHATSDDYAAVGTDYLLVDANGARGGRGFYDQHARMWSRDGRLLATTQQIVTYRTQEEGN
jgi:acyl-CoA thioesterase